MRVTRTRKKMMATNLIFLRKQKNVTNVEISKKTGLSESALSRWENAKRFPSYESLLILSEYYQIPIAYFDQDITKIKL